MRFFCVPVIIIALYVPAAAQQQPDFNLEYISNIGIDFPDTIPSAYHGYTDVWGWEAPDGSAYAIVGVGHGTVIFDVTDPVYPTEVDFVPGALSRWRDFKSYENYIYVTADEGRDGVVIIDMSTAPDSVSFSHFTPSLTVQPGLSDTLTTCHNLYIDGTYLYLSGCRIDGNSGTGVLIFDLSMDPTAPVYVGSTGSIEQYSHDVYVQDDRLYSSDFWHGVVTIWDVSDPANPVILAAQETTDEGQRGTHNAWVSTDGQYLFTTNEVTAGQVRSFNIEELDDTKYLDAYVPSGTRGLGVIPHNVHYHQGYLVTSFYSDGLKILDAHRPENLVEVGSFDTYHFRDGGFTGLWGAYPFTTSGLIYGSDRSSGLWIFQPSYARAAYVEGMVVDETDTPIPGVKVALSGEKIANDFTAADGTFRLGTPDAGAATLLVNDNPVDFPEYPKLRIDTVLQASEVIFLKVVLVELGNKTIRGTVLDAETRSPLAGAEVRVFSDREGKSVHTEEDGSFTIETPSADHVIGAGMWGWQPDFRIQESLEIETSMTFLLEKGYRDDFEFDHGWTVDPGPENRPIDEWARGVPIGARYDSIFVNPNEDLSEDFGKSCFVTGLSGGLRGNLSGSSTLQSPPFNGANYSDPVLYYSIWYYAGGVLQPDDSLSIYVGNGQEERLVELLVEGNAGWRSRSEVRLLDHLTLSDSMYLRLVARDGGQVHIYEAAIDGFAVTEGFTTSSEDEELGSVRMVPNPTYDDVRIMSDSPVRVRVVDAAGRAIWSSQREDTQHQFSMLSLANGIYFVRLEHRSGKTSAHKILKL
ncbi:MAG: choice-of-anchor B family protein [Saprospiraceae bacterium]|nr:choice-of-anchor B family protein [Saprospiraceae bacterium]